MRGMQSPMGTPVDFPNAIGRDSYGKGDGSPAAQMMIILGAMPKVM